VETHEVPALAAVIWGERVNDFQRRPVPAQAGSRSSNAELLTILGVWDGGRENTRSMTMSFRGHVEKGVVIFDEPTAIPEGTVVEVVVCEVSPANVPAGPSLWDRLKDVAGKAKGLPRDASTRVDHYLTHGLPEP
jgi:hypothetical protein